MSIEKVIGEWDGQLSCSSDDELPGHACCRRKRSDCPHPEARFGFDAHLLDELVDVFLPRTPRRQGNSPSVANDPNNQRPTKINCAASGRSSQLPRW